MSQQQTTLSPIDADLGAHIQQVLTEYLVRSQRRTAEQINEEFAAAVDSLARFVLSGGKRIRPTFAWWGYRGAGGSPDGRQAEAMLLVASSLELIQACALVHDDLMDASDRRRGAPTVHVAYAEEHRRAGWLGTPERFGQAAAILLGDLALMWADDMFHSAGLDQRALRAATEPWQAMRTEVLAGQYLDVLTQARGDESVSAALEIDRLKTAAYTVERPLHLGAVIAGADPEVVSTFRRFGADVGIAFQLRDDMLGVFGDPTVTGKPAGDDLREGKRTLLVALGLQHAEESRDADAAHALRSAIGDPDLTEEALADVRRLLTDLGAVAAVEQRIQRLTESALRALGSAPIAEPAATRLAELVVAATARNH